MCQCSRTTFKGFAPGWTRNPHSPQKCRSSPWTRRTGRMASDATVKHGQHPAHRRRTHRHHPQYHHHLVLHGLFQNVHHLGVRMGSYSVQMSDDVSDAYSATMRRVSVEHSRHSHPNCSMVDDGHPQIVEGVDDDATSAVRQRLHHQLRQRIRRRMRHRRRTFTTHWTSAALREPAFRALCTHDVLARKDAIHAQMIAHNTFLHGRSEWIPHGGVGKNTLIFCD